MTELTAQQIKDAVLLGLKEVADRFAKDPRPTDGSVQSALAGIVAKPNGKSGQNGRRAVRGGRR